MVQKEIVAVAQEGTYRLINRKHGTKEARDGWLPMRERLKEMKERRDATTFDLKIQAQKNLENSRTNKSINAISNKFEKIRKTKGNEEAAKYLKSVGNKYDILRNKRKNEVEQEMRRLTQEMRRLETQWYHDFYKKHAREYGFTYVFEKKKQRLKAVK